MTCDICRRTCEEAQIENLAVIYRQEGISRVCPACANWANSKLREIRLTNDDRLKWAIREHADEFELAPGAKRLGLIIAVWLGIVTVAAVVLIWILFTFL